MRNIEEVRLSLEAHTRTPEDVLQEWYYRSEATSPLDDVPCLDFSSQVHCYCVDTYFPLAVPLQELDPTTHALTLFYRARAAYGGEVHLLGCIPYHALRYTLRGIVCEEDMTRFHSRSAMPVIVPSSIGTTTPSAPISLPLIADATLFQQRAPLRADEVLPAFHRRCAIYRGNGSDGSGDGGDEKVLLILTTLLGAFIEFAPTHLPMSGLDARLIRLAYEKARMKVESQRYSLVGGGGGDERSLLQMLYANHLGGWISSPEGAVVPTPLDQQAFHALYGGDAPRYIPQLYLRVRAYEVAPEVLQKLPLYEGGYVHLPCYAEAIFPWLRRVWQSDAQRQYTRMNREWFSGVSSEMEGSALGRALQREARAMTAFFFRHSHPLSGGGGGGDKKSVSPKETMDTSAPRIAPLGDIEDTWKVVPPCISLLRSRGAFPKHRARMDLTPILKEAGLSYEDAERFYEHMNNAYPRELGVPLRGRYTLKYDWEKTRPSVFCGALIQNALVRGMEVPGENLVCPFARSSSLENTPENRPLINAHCYRACSEATALGNIRFRKPSEVIHHLAEKQRFISQIHSAEGDPDEDPEEEEEEAWDLES